MLKRNLIACLSLCLASAVAALGCTTDEPSTGSTGALELNLELAGEAEIDEVLYQISRPGMPPMGGIIDTSAPGATASVEVFGLPEGGGYFVELRAVGDGKVVCQGSAPFSVLANRATPVAVMLNCNPEERYGSVRVNGKLNVCAELTKVVVAPLETSVGSRIDLSMAAEDSEGDGIAYFWSASGGPIANPESAVTTYTCATEGRQFIEAFASDDEFGGCIDNWRVEVRCGSGDGGTGGSGGSAGSGGSGGTGGVLACLELNPSCNNGDIDPIQEDPSCMLEEPPVLADGCDGTESVINPTTCTPTGNDSVHQVQLIAVDGDCNSGFNLDNCNGVSCNVGGLAPGEGIDGVDNALAGLAPVLSNVGGNLGGVDQALYNGLCDGSIALSYIVDANPAENCANLTPSYGGIRGDTIPVNLSDTGCVSGTLGTIPIPVAGVQGELGNAVFRGTADVSRGFNVSLGATVADETARAIADALIDGGSAVVAQVFDISSNLEGNVAAACSAISLTLDVGATRVDSEAGACTDSSNAAVYAGLEYEDQGGTTYRGVEAAQAISEDCLSGIPNSEPPVNGCFGILGDLVACFPICAPELIETLSRCVARCTSEAIATASPPGLSSSCVSCYSDEVACGSAFCLPQCATDTSAPACVQCRCDNDCTPAFSRCSGIPSDVCE